MGVFQTPPTVLRPTEHEHVFQIAPIPFYYRLYEGTEIFNQEIVRYGQQLLNEQQKRMGQELPGQYDTERKHRMRGFQPRYITGSEDQWVEPRYNVAVGSHFWTPPNNILAYDSPEIRRLANLVLEAFSYLLQCAGYTNISEPRISESWMQFYPPQAGRGHNLHSHCRYRIEEEAFTMWSGAYYLDDGEPVSDHIYSGKLVFNIRGYSYVIRPKPGLLMLWPSDLLHEVKPFYGQRERVVVNFNIFSDFAGDRQLDHHQFVSQAGH